MHNNKPMQDNIKESYLFVDQKKGDPLQYEGVTSVSILSIFAGKLKGKTLLLSGRHLLKSLAFKRPI